MVMAKCTLVTVEPDGFILILIVIILLRQELVFQDAGSPIRMSDYTLLTLYRYR